LESYASGNKFYTSHELKKKGTYVISECLKDQHGDVVIASLSVTMPCNKTFKPLITMILEKYPILFKILKILF